MWEEFWVNSLKCLFCYQSSGAFSFKSSVNFFHLIFSKPKTKEQIWKGNVIHELILQTKNHSCNNSMVYCSWHYSRLAIKNLTPWLHKVDPNFLAGICEAILILRLQALEKRKCNEMLTWFLFRRFQIWWNFFLEISKIIGIL